MSCYTVVTIVAPPNIGVLPVRRVLESARHHLLSWVGRHVTDVGALQPLDLVVEMVVNPEYVSEGVPNDA